MRSWSAFRRRSTKSTGGFFFEIKRGEKAPAGKTVIPNDEVGRALLSFDIQEPWSAHQIYKVFDDKYAEIFGGPQCHGAAESSSFTSF